ncbi:MAG TPA: ABC transporter permease [Trebonia sp.]|jgi:ABC-type nitrate/sulfonate/bicarbonate transport system permease component|nr:ABC transporter permease [Trebonia sp.]
MTTVLDQQTPSTQAGKGRGSSRAARGGGKAAVRFLTGLTPLVLLLVIWQLVGTYASPYFPTPKAWWDGVGALRTAGQLWPAIGYTLRTFIIALVLNTVIGSVLGFLMGGVRLADRSLGPTTEFIRAIPAAALVPVLVLIMGISETTDVAVVVAGTLWPVMISTRSAMRRMNPVLRDVARTLRLSRRDWLVKVAFPALLPSILVGIQVMAPMTLIVTLLVEIVTGTSGVGGLLSSAEQNFMSAQVYGLVCVAGLIALVINVCVHLIEHYTSRHLR